MAYPLSSFFFVLGRFLFFLGRGRGAILAACGMIVRCPQIATGREGRNADYAYGRQAMGILLLLGLATQR